MSNTILTTPVDTLVKIVKENQPCTLSFLKDKLRLPLELIEKWLVVLEEYKIISVTYKGLEGFVRINEKEFNQEELSPESLKEAFIDKCVKRKIPFSKMALIWPKFIIKFEKELKELFIQEALKAGHTKNKTEIAWVKFRKELERF